MFLYHKNLVIFYLLFCILCLSSLSAARKKAHTSHETPNSDKKTSIFFLEDFDIEYKTPTPSEPAYFYETFDSVRLAKLRWVPSQAHKQSTTSSQELQYTGQWSFEHPERRLFPNDLGMVLRSKARHAAISAKLHRKFQFTTRPLVVQYEVTFQKGMECGGAYIKLITDSKHFSQEAFNDQTPYTIMFGPDKCGGDIKLHFIFRHKNPLNGSYEEKHARQGSNKMEETYTDHKPHIYRLILRPDNTYEMFVDGSRVNSGNLLEDVDPPVNPPMEVEDRHDKKPATWDDRPYIPNPKAVKPPDWDDNAPLKIPDPHAKPPVGWLEDQPELVPDLEATPPTDWDVETDGEWKRPLIPNPNCEFALGCGPWERPLVDNPKFKGRWTAPLIDNPDYKGPWKRRKIPNPLYFQDKEPFKMGAVGAIGLEIWTMTENVLFDNFIVAEKESVVDGWTEKTYNLKTKAIQQSERSIIERIIQYSNKYPWLYAVYTVGIGLPLAILLAFCSEGASNQKGKHQNGRSYDDDHDDYGSGHYGSSDSRTYQKASPTFGNQLTRRCTQRHHSHHTYHNHNHMH